jgi:hypothetical protein
MTVRRIQPKPKAADPKPSPTGHVNGMAVFGLRPKIRKAA